MNAVETKGGNGRGEKQGGRPGRKLLLKGGAVLKNLSRGTVNERGK